MGTASPSRAVIDLAAYVHNLNAVRRSIPARCKLMAVVKADAYGLGAVPLARKAKAAGAEMLAVATVEEGEELRETGIEGPILVLVQPQKDALATALENDLRVAVSEVSLAERLDQLAHRASRIAIVHCMVDTGMGREGFPIDSAVDEMQYVARFSHIDIEGVGTHLATADAEDVSFATDQIRAFKHLLKRANKAGIPFEMAHAACSAAVVNHPSSAFDMVRTGLMTYGVWPAHGAPAPISLKPVLRWESRVVLVKNVRAGSSVGYGRTYVAPEPARIAIVPVGYADGYPYQASNRADVLIHGHRCPIRGTVCMDQIAADVTALSACEIGDPVVLIGSDGDERIDERELARHAQTIPYDILTGLGARVTREYIE